MDNKEQPLIPVSNVLKRYPESWDEKEMYDATEPARQMGKEITALFQKITGKEKPAEVKSVEISGGTWDRLRNTYTTHNADITTEYQLPEIGGPFTFGKLRTLTERSYKTIEGKDGLKYQVEMVKDKKTGEWRQRTMTDKVGEMFGGLNKTGSIVEVREEGKEPSYKLIVTTADRPVFTPKQPIIDGFPVPPPGKYI
jgi:hypothetical protein